MKIGIVAQEGSLLETYLDALGESSLSDAEVALYSASSDHQSASIMYKGRPLPFSAIADVDFADTDLVVVLDNAVVVEAYQSIFESVVCPVIGLQQSLAPLKPELYSGQQPKANTCGVLDAAVSSIQSAIGSVELESLDVKMFCSAESVGQAGVQELAAQTARLLNAQPLENRVFSKQLPFNCFPMSEHQAGRDMEVAFKKEAGQVFKTDAVSSEAIQMPFFHGKTLLVSAVFASSSDVKSFVEQPAGDSSFIKVMNKATDVSHLALTDEDAIAAVAEVRAFEFDDNRVDFWLILEENKVVVHQSLMPLSELLLKNSL